MFISDNSVESAWTCVPPKQSKNDYAIFFVITDNYSFAAANMIMGLYKYSPNLMSNVDIVIYHNGISEKNVMLLNRLHDNILYKEVTFPESWRSLVEHPRNDLWGSIIIAKLFGFFLIQNYKKVLMMDVDMLITGDISELFKIEEAMAWRRVVIWKATELFQSILKDKDDFASGPNGGLVLFTERLKEFNISPDDIPKAFEKVRDLIIEGSKRIDGGNDERVLSWIVYDKCIPLKELDIHQYNTTIQNVRPETKLIHFLKYRSAETKPWLNLAAFLYFKDWADNYQHWVNMGGEGPVNYSDEDYYKLFAFDLRGKIEKQNKKISQLENNNKALVDSERCLIMSCDKEIKKENEKLRRQLEGLQNSASWKITKPFRVIAKKFRYLKKKVKSCFKK